MIVPSNRLLTAFAAVWIILVCTTVLVPWLSQAAYILLICFALVVILDAVCSGSVFDGITVEFPSIIRMSRQREASLSINVNNAENKRKNLKLGLFFSSRYFSAQNEKDLELKEGVSNFAVNWQVTARKQGKYFLEKCHLQRESVLGFWQKRKKQKIHCELRIYPDLFSEKKALASLFLDSGAGIHNLLQVGKGKEFEKLREYEPGDNYEDIHWKATAKRGIPISKVYQIERTQDVYVMIDSSRMSARSLSVSGQIETEDEMDKPKESILEKYIATALMVGMACLSQGDNFGIGVFSDRVKMFIPAGKGKAHFDSCRDMLYTLDHESVTPDFSELITFAGNKIRTRSLIILLTNLDDNVLAEKFLKNIHILSRRHVVAVNMLNPASAYPIFSSETIESIEDIYKNLAGHMIWSSLNQLKMSLNKLGIGFFLCDKRHLSFNVISNYLSIKKRQVL